MKTIFIIVGTRPEVIKMSSLYHELKQNPDIRIKLILTGQHQDLVYGVLRSFNIKEDAVIMLPKQNRTLSDLTCDVLQGLQSFFKVDRPDMVLVHGDTTSAFSGALSCFYHQIPFAHVEAGLRTNRLDSPFPEEFNRQQIAKFASLHFSPDERSKSNLIKEGVPESRICISGNTSMDSLRRVIPELNSDSQRDVMSVLVTLHRRENKGERLMATLQSIKQLALLHSAVTFRFPVHPGVTEPVYSILSGINNVRLLQPLDYVQFIRLLALSQIIMTDSGGVQEEASFFQKPCLVIRDCSERVDNIGKTVFLINPLRESLTQKVSSLLKMISNHSQVKQVQVFGQTAASIIAERLCQEAFA